MSVKKNFIYNITYQILIMIIPLLTTPYVARVIGAEGIGVQSYTYSIVNYFVLFAMLGVNNHGNRSIAMIRENKENLSKTFWSIYSLQAIMSIIMIIIYSCYSIFIVKDNKVIALIQTIYILGALLDINWFFFGMEQFKLTVIRNTIIKIVSAISIFVFVKESTDLYLYSLILVVGTLISQAVLWRYIWKYISFVKIKKEDIVQHIKPSLILFIPIIAVSIYKIMDKIMLGSISGMAQVGFYENSEKIISIPIGIITALATVMLPKMSNLQSNNNIKESERYISISISFVMFIVYGSMFGLIGIGDIFIPIFLGDKFNECINIVYLLSTTLIFIGWANVIRTQFLIPRKKDEIFIKSTILGAIVNVICNLILVAKMGAIGAAIGTVFAEMVVAIYQTIKVKDDLPVFKYFKRTSIYIIPGILMLISIKMIGYKYGQSIFIGIIQIILGGVIYILSIIFFIIKNNNKLIKDILIEFKSKFKLKKLG